MTNKHNKLSGIEFIKNIWTDCADAMTGRFSAPFFIFGTVATTWLAFNQTNLALLLIASAVLFCSYKQVKKERDVIICLEEKSDNRIAKQTALNKIWLLRAEGTHHRNMHYTVTNETEYQKWKNIYDKWRSDILREAEIISPNLKMWIEVVNVMDVSKMPLFASRYCDDDFIKKYQIFCEILNRIERFLIRDLVLEKDR